MARKKLRIKWRTKGFRELRLQPRVAADVQRRAERVAAAAGDGFVAEKSEGRNRARSAVIAVTYKARRRSAEDNVLIKALDAGR